MRQGIKKIFIQTINGLKRTLGARAAGAQVSRLSYSLRSARVFASLVFILLVAAAGLFFFVRQAHAYQIKRIIRGNYTFLIGTEATTIDISGQLGGTGINNSNAFILLSRRHTSDSHSAGDILNVIDDPTNLLLARINSATNVSTEYQVVEFN